MRPERTSSDVGAATRRADCGEAATHLAVGRLLGLGGDLLDGGRPVEAARAYLSALRTASALWHPVLGFPAFRELLGLVLEGSLPGETAREIRDEVADFGVALSLTPGRVDLVLPQIADSLRTADGGVEVDVRAALFGLDRRLAECPPLPTLDRGLLLVARAEVGRPLGSSGLAARRAVRELLAWPGAAGACRDRLLVRALLLVAEDAQRRDDLTAALNAGNSAVGHARGLTGGFRTALLAESLETLGGILGRLGRHAEAAVVATEAVCVAVLEGR